MLFTPLIPLDNNDFKLAAVHMELLDVVHDELQFVFEIIAVMDASVLVVLGTHAELLT